MLFVFMLFFVRVFAFHDPWKMKQARSIVLQQFSNYMHMIVIVMPAADLRFRFSGLAIRDLFEPLVILSGLGMPRVVGKALNCVASE